MRSLAWSLAVACVAILAESAAAQQTITVRILDYRSAKPMTRLWLEIDGFSGNRLQGRAPKTAVVMRRLLKSKTDKNGTVVVSIPEPLPEHLRVFSFELFGSLPDICVADVLRTGTVMQYRRGIEAQRRKESEHPGEVLIFSRRVTSWDRLLQEIP